jgi:hypothetical protein
MNLNFKKYGSVMMGVLCGFVLSGGIVVADTGTPSSGNPNIYGGTTGNRAVSGAARGRFGSLQQLGMEIIRFMETIIVPFIMAMALLAFLWGVLQFIRKGNEPAEREQGRQFMLWGIIGLAVMASVWGLVRILTNTIGVPLGIPSVSNIQ